MDEPARVPSVSLAGALEPRSPHAAEVAHDIGQALDTSGAVYITDHGVPDDLLVVQFAVARALFELPPPQRSRLVRSVVAPPADDDAADATWDCFECFAIKALSRDGEPAVLAPHADAPAWLMHATARYVTAMSHLSRRLLQLLAMSLGQPRDAFGDGDTSALGVLRMLMYRELPQAAPGPGAQAHTDHGALTVLAQDSHPGLTGAAPGRRPAAAPGRSAVDVECGALPLAAPPRAACPWPGREVVAAVLLHAARALTHWAVS